MMMDEGVAITAEKYESYVENEVYEIAEAAGINESFAKDIYDYWSTYLYTCYPSAELSRYYSRMMRRAKKEGLTFDDTRDIYYQRFEKRG